MAHQLTKEDYICPECGHIGHGARRIRGSAAIERLLWYTLLVPGPFYSWWRRTGKRVACPGCGGENLVPLDSTLGAALLEKRLRAK